MKSKKLFKPLLSIALAVLLLSTFAVNAMASYNTWEHTGQDTVIVKTGSIFSKKIISKHVLDSYVYENLSDQKGARAVCDHYTYHSDSDTYTYGWKNSTDCYARARIEASGQYFLDTGRIYNRYQSKAETNGVWVGIAHTYCGNKLAD